MHFNLEPAQEDEGGVNHDGFPKFDPKKPYNYRTNVPDNVARDPDYIELRIRQKSSLFYSRCLKQTIGVLWGVSILSQFIKKTYGAEGDFADALENTSLTAGVLSILAIAGLNNYIGEHKLAKDTANRIFNQQAYRDERLETLPPELRSRVTYGKLPPY